MANDTNKKIEKVKTKYTLTTVDNPYSPLEDFDAWYSQDLQLAAINGRPTTFGLIDRLSGSSEYLSEDEKEAMVEQAIDDIIANDAENIYVRIKIDE